MKICLPVQSGNFFLYPKSKRNDKEHCIVEQKKTAEDFGRMGINERLKALLPLAKAPGINAVNEPANKKPENNSHKNVAQIMNAQIQAGVAIKQRPRKHKDIQLFAAEKKTKECCNSKRVGGMGREESEPPSPIIVHGIKRIHENRVLGGTPTVEKGFENAGGKRVREENAQSEKQNDGYEPGRRGILPDKPKDDKPKGYPNKR